MATFQRTKSTTWNRTGTFKSTGRGGYSYDVLSDWEKQNKSALDLINGYAGRISNGEWLSAEDREKYKAAIDSYTKTGTSLRNISKKMGQKYTVDEEKSWNDSIASLQTGYSSVNDFYNQFGDETTYGYFSKRFADDYADNSKYVSTKYGDPHLNIFSGTYDDTGFGDIEYDYINKNTDAANIKLTNDTVYGSTLAGTDKSERFQMTDDEIGLFNYIYKTEGKDAAYAFVDYLESDLNARQRQATQDAWAKYANEKPFESSVFSILTSPLKGISYIGQATDFISDGKIDQNAGYNKYSYVNSAIRNQVSQQIEASGKWGEVGSFAYQTGMSMGDFLFNTAITGGNQALSLALMGTGAAADTVLASKDRGLEDWQAFTLGTIAGAVEIVAEKASIDALFDAALLGKDALTYVVKNALSEGSEELVTSVVNMIADLAISGDEAEFMLAIKEKGLGQAVGEQVLSLGADFLGGAISGGIMGGGAAGINSVGVAIKGSDIKRGYISNPGLLTDVALSYDPNNTFAQKMHNKGAKGGELSNYQVGKLATQIGEGMINQDTSKIKSAAEARLTELGETGNVSAIAEALTKQVKGEKLSLTEKKLIHDSSQGYLVASEMDRSNLKGGGLANKWAESIGTKVINADVYGKQRNGNAGIIQNIKPAVSVPEKEKEKYAAEVEKAVLIKGADGKAVKTEITGVEVEGDHVTYTLSNGEKVGEDKVTFRTENEKLVAKMATEKVTRVKGFSTEAATAMIRGYDGSIGISDYGAAVNDAFRYGVQGVPVKEVSTGVNTSKANQAAMFAIYDIGRQYGKASSVKPTFVNSKKTETKGGVLLAKTIDENTLTDRQKAEIKGLDIVGRALGVDINIFESEKNDLGEHIGENGRYHRDIRSIDVDLHSGSKGQGILLNTASHELTHHIREVAPEKFKVFADALFEEYGKKGVSVDALITARLEELRSKDRLNGLSEEAAYDLAYEEVVADAAETMLTDSDALARLSEKLKAKDKGLWNTIKDFFGNLVKKVQSIYKEINPESYEARLVRDMEDGAKRLQDLWVEGVAAASEVNNSAEKAHLSTLSAENSQKTPLTNINQEDMHVSGDIKYMDRNGKLKNAEELSESDLRYLLENVQNGGYSNKTYIPLRRNTPKFFIEVVKEHSRGEYFIEDYPMAATVEHMRQNMEEDDGRHYGKNRPHGLNIDDIITISREMGDPSYIVLQENGRYAEVVSFYNKRNKKVVVAIDVANEHSVPQKNYKHSQYMNGYNEGCYNIIVTQYEPDDLETYLTKNEIVYDKKKMNGKYQVGSGRIVTVTHDTPFIEDIISQKPDSVNTKFSDRKSAEDSFSNRALLAKALESVATNEVEKKKLAEYKSNIQKMNNESMKLAELKKEIKELSFGKGPRDNAKLKTLQDEARKTANRIDLYDKRLLNLEATSALKAVMEREKQKAYKAAAEKGREALHRNVEGRHKTAEIHKIQRVAKDLDKLLNRGTKERNVKNGEIGIVRAALDLSNMLFVSDDELLFNGFGTRVTTAEAQAMDAYVELYEEYHSYDNAVTENKGRRAELRSQMNDLKSEFSDALERERNRISEAKAVEAYDALIREYESLAKAEEDYLKKAYRPEVAEYLKTFREEIGETLVTEMSLEQLERLYKGFTMIKHMVSESNKLFRDGKRESYADRVETIYSNIDSLKKLFGGDYPEKIGKLLDKLNEFGWNNLRPVDAFELAGSEAFSDLFWDNIKAQDVYGRDFSEVAVSLIKAREKYGYNRWKIEETKDFKTDDGRTFTVTLGEMMSIYAYSKRDQADGHMREGGFQHEKDATYKDKNGIRRKRAKEAQTYRVGDKMKLDIISSLTKEQRAYVDEMQALLTKWGEKGNEASRILYGIDLFTESVYFPLVSSKDYLSSVSTEIGQTVTTASLAGSGMTKATVPGADNPIILRAFDDVILEHFDKMSKYHAYVVPIDNIRKVFDGQIKTENGDMLSIKALIGSHFGKGASEYFQNYITDLNGSASISGASNPFESFFSKSKGASVAANISVWIQQYFSIIRALGEVNPRYFLPFMGESFKKPDMKLYDEMKKYAPVTVIKEMGGFDVGSNRGINDYLGYEGARMTTKKAWKKFQDALGVGAQAMDKLGWMTIWKGVKKEVAATGKYKTGSDEYYKACGERFEQIITKTQVYDSVNAKSGYMRSKKTAVKYLVSFMGEPTTIVGMAEVSVIRFERAVVSKDKTKIKEAGAKLASNLAAIVVSTAMTSVAKSLVYAMRDDDEDETYLEKYAEALGKAFRDDINLLNYFPIARDIASIIEGYDVERPDMTLVADLINNFRKAYDALLDEDAEDDEKLQKYINAGLSLANILGIPAKTIYRDINGLVNTLNNIGNNYRTDFGDKFTEGWKGEELTKGEKLYQSIVSGDSKLVDYYKSTYKDESTYLSAVRKALRDNDPRLEEAALARLEGDTATYDEFEAEVIAEGNFDEKLIEAAFKAEYNYHKGKAKEAEERGEEYP